MQWLPRCSAAPLCGCCTGRAGLTPAERGCGERHRPEGGLGLRAGLPPQPVGPLQSELVAEHRPRTGCWCPSRADRPRARTRPRSGGSSPGWSPNPPGGIRGRAPGRARGWRGRGTIRGRWGEDESAGLMLPGKALPEVPARARTGALRLCRQLCRPRPGAAGVTRQSAERSLCRPVPASVRPKTPFVPSCPRCPRAQAQENKGKFGWGARIRTWEWRYQKPLPYRLATPHRGDAASIAARAGRGNHPVEPRRARC